MAETLGGRAARILWWGWIAMLVVAVYVFFGHLEWYDSMPVVGQIAVRVACVMAVIALGSRFDPGSARVDHGDRSRSEP